MLHCSSDIVDKSSRSFRFQAAWVSHEDFAQVVRNAWTKGDKVVPNSLENVKNDALVFNSEVFGNIFRKKKKLEVRIRGIQRRLEKVDILRLVLLEKELQKEYNEVLRQEEMLWYPKSREKWVKMGDRKLSFSIPKRLFGEREIRFMVFFVTMGIGAQTLWLFNLNVPFSIRSFLRGKRLLSQTLLGTPHASLEY